MNNLANAGASSLRDSDRKPDSKLGRPRKAPLSVEQLTAEAFEPFGEVVETAGRDFERSADGFIETYSDLAMLDVLTKDGRPRVTLVRASPRKLPFRILGMERQPQSTRTIMPLLFYPFLIIVAKGAEPDPAKLRAFASDGQQGVNVSRGIWQHQLIALKRRMNFLVIDRAGPGRDREEILFDRKLHVTIEI